MPANHSNAALLVAALVAACGSKPTTPPAPSAPPAAPHDEATVAVAAPVPDAGAIAVDSPPIVAPRAGADFIDEARWLFRIAGCGDGPLPTPFAGDPDRAATYQRVIDQHCKAIAPDVAKFREVYFVNAPAWLDAHVPADVPSSVVYPFGGGDLLSALAAFRSATEITTISLELAGDPRRVADVTAPQLAADLARFRNEIAWLIRFGSNTSVNLSAQQRNHLPGQTSSFLLALAIGGYEPVAMRYFTIDDQGAIHYLEKSEIEADTKSTKSLGSGWRDPNFAESFRNVEISYRKVGEASIRTHRHIAWNLDNKHLKERPGLLRQVEAKGKVAIIVKGASYLLWQREFATIRTYILDHLAFMLSDSTGIPPMYAGPAGMVQEAYGRYVRAGLPHAAGSQQDYEMRQLWKNPAGPAPFRFGYVDGASNHHLLITRPK